MKIEVINDNKLLLYISKEYIKDLNLYEKEKLELYFRNLFVRLKEKYELDIFGYYDITVYRDYNYGGIILLEKDDSDYFNYYGKQIDMCIKIDNNDLFLYMIDNIWIINTNIVDKIKIYKYKDKMYLRIISNIDSYQIGRLLEHTTIVYGNIVNDIIKRGKVIDYKTMFV